MYTQLYKG